MTSKSKIRMTMADEDTAIIAAAQSDPDNPPLTEEQLAHFVPARDVPEKVARLKKKNPWAAKGSNENTNHDRHRPGCDRLFQGRWPGLADPNERCPCVRLLA